MTLRPSRWRPAGCATSPYQRAGNGDDVAAAVSRSAAGDPGAQPGVPGAGRCRRASSGGYDLAASRLVWTQPADVTVRVAAGACVLVHGSKAAPPASPNGQLVGRDLATGAVLWQHPSAIIRRAVRLCAGRRRRLRRRTGRRPGEKPTGRPDRAGRPHRRGALENGAPVGARGGAGRAGRAHRRPGRIPVRAALRRRDRRCRWDRSCRPKRRRPSCARCPRGCSTGRAGCS